jgi:hypothetical protein
LAAAETREPVNLFGHSHGALCISRGVHQAEHAIGGDAKHALSLVSVQTFGGAALTYSAGPHYLHHMNQDDRIVQETGYGHVLHAGVMTLERHFDKSDVHFDLFRDPRNVGGRDPDHHSFADIYLPRLDPSSVVERSFPLYDSRNGDDSPSATTDSDPDLLIGDDGRPGEAGAADPAQDQTQNLPDRDADYGDNEYHVADLHNDAHDDDYVSDDPDDDG